MAAHDYDELKVIFCFIENRSTLNLILHILYIYIKGINKYFKQLLIFMEIFFIFYKGIVH